jgi:hypothetical protein
MTPARTAPESQVTGYTVVLPPGWCRIPVRFGSAKTIRAVVDEALKAVPRNVPRDRIPPYRAELEGKLQKMVREARAKGGVDLYMPIGPMHGIPVSASFIVSEGAAGTGSEEIDPAALVTYLATEDGFGAPVEVDGAPAVRTEHVADPEPSAELDAGSRRVDYIIPVPGTPDRWLLVAFSTLGAGSPDDELSGILVQLFDAIMSTFRWNRGGSSR